MPTTISKPWWSSKTILGAVAVLVALIIRAAVPDTDLDEGAILDVLTKAAETAGALLAIFGRVVAETTIRLRR